jgi:hypothetical protein
MVDELHTSNDERHHVIELVMHLHREPGSESAGAVAPGEDTGSGGSSSEAEAPGDSEEGPDARR